MDSVSEFLNKTLDYFHEYALMRYKRLTRHKQKITPRVFKEEIVAARLIGELSAAEKILVVTKENPDWTKEELEGELHMFVNDANNLYCKYTEIDRVIKLDEVVKEYTYTGD